MGLGPQDARYLATSDETMVEELWARACATGIDRMRRRAQEAGEPPGSLLCVCGLVIGPQDPDSCPNCGRIVGERQDPEDPTDDDYLREAAVLMGGRDA